MISFIKITRKLNKGEFISFKPSLNKTGNMNVTFVDRNGNELITQVFYDPLTNEIWPLENFSDFMEIYRQYVTKVTSKTMLKTIGEVDPDIINANICWAVTDNMKELLAADTSPKPPDLESDNPEVIIPFIQDELWKNHLLIILQDPNSQDHWFALIGQDGLVHLVEHTEHTCNFSETFTIDSLLDQFNNILSGQQPDRFYGITGPHTFLIWSYPRKPLWSKTIYSYLK